MVVTNKKQLFGVAGFPVNFLTSPYKKNRDNIFKWLNDLSLNILELQCTYGIRMQDEQALRYKKLAEENNVLLTIHAPYYINLGSKKSQTVENSKHEIIKAFKLANLIGASRIIFHPGGGHGKTAENRIEGINQIIDSLNEIKPCIDTTSVKIYPEIGGKVSSLGSLDEIIRICQNVDYAYPCIDLAHLHARENGSMTSIDKIISVLNKIESELSRNHLENTHFHMYPVDYTEGGEKIHKTFTDRDELGSPFLPLADDSIKAIKIKNVNPLVICEAHNTQDTGAILMRDIYNNLL
jgi:deoxyribonuclease-4